MLRTIEIVMSLILEVCLSHGAVDFAGRAFIFKVAGSGLVILSAALMALSDYVNGCLAKKTCNVESLEEEEEEALIGERALEGM